MNRRQKIMLVIAAINLALILLFPPFDTFSINDSIIPIFSGFHFAFNKLSNEVINSSLLYLEIAVVLINTGIAWLIMQDKNDATQRKTNFQNAALLGVAINLVIILLFPPLEIHSAMTYAIFPSFQGFYFIFSAPPEHVIVTAMLYLEVIFILVNGALFWLMFGQKNSSDLTEQQAVELLQALKKNR